MPMQLQNNQQDNSKNITYITVTLTVHVSIQDTNAEIRYPGTKIMPLSQIGCAVVPRMLLDIIFVHKTRNVWKKYNQPQL